MDYREALDWLYGTQLFGIKLGLENVERLLRETGLDESLEGREILHVAGTNGKGSVCAMAESILRSDGVKTGLFTSPHLVTFRERIRVDGEMIPESEVAEGLSEWRERVANWDPHPTFFELTFALAMAHFCDHEVETLILETGMGGRLDATNAVTSSVAVLTPIGLDHTQWLGETLAEIAAEKAGIIKLSRPVLSARQEPDAAAVIEREAKAKEAPLHWIDAEDEIAISEDQIGLAGPHQRANAALAVAAAQAVRPELSNAAVQRGLASVDWPARFQQFEEDRIILDGAHNAPAAEALVATWNREMAPGATATVVFGGVESKDTEAVMTLLAPLVSRWVFVTVASRRGRPAEELEAGWEAVRSNLRLTGTKEIPVLMADDAATALEMARSADPEGWILVTGSLYLAGEALASLRGGRAFEVSEQ